MFHCVTLMESLLTGAKLISLLLKVLRLIDTTASICDLNYFFQEPTHIPNSSSSWINLISTWQSNLVMESGIYLFLHWNCHNQVVFSEFNLSIFYPLLYERTAWYYERQNTELIRRKCYWSVLLVKSPFLCQFWWKSLLFHQDAPQHKPISFYMKQLLVMMEICLK